MRKAKKQQTKTLYSYQQMEIPADLERVANCANAIDSLIRQREEVEKGGDWQFTSHGLADYGRHPQVQVAVSRDDILAAYDAKLTEGLLELAKRMAPVLEKMNVVRQITTVKL